MGFFDRFRSTDARIDRLEDDIDRVYDAMAESLSEGELQQLKTMLELSDAFTALMKEHGIGMPGLSYMRGVAKTEVGGDPVPFFMMFGFGQHAVETSEKYAASERERVKNKLDWSDEKERDNGNKQT